MDAMAIDTSGDRRVARPQPLAVHAGQILAVLVHALPGVVLAHEVRVAMAARAELGNRCPGRNADESVSRAHGGSGIVGVGISTVAVRAGKPLLRVDARS